MTQQELDERNVHMAKHLIDSGAIGARLLSAKQIGNAAFRLSLQTVDDRRIEVVFKTDVQYVIKSTMEIQQVNAGKNSGSTGS